MLMGGIVPSTSADIRRLRGGEPGGRGYRQVQVKAFINERMAIDGLAPSVSMIAEKFNMDRGNVSRLIASLARHGFIALGDGYQNRKQRRIRI